MHPDTVNDDVGQLNQRFRGVIEERGGKVLKVDNWGKRRLSYEIRKQRKGIYLYWQYLGDPNIVAELERNMRLLDPVIRYMTIKVDEDVDPSARPTEMDDESYEAAATTAADEEEIMMGAAPAAAPWWSPGSSRPPGTPSPGRSSGRFPGSSSGTTPHSSTKPLLARVRWHSVEVRAPGWKLSTALAT